MLSPTSANAALPATRTAAAASRETVAYRPVVAGDRRSYTIAPDIPVLERRRTPRQSVIVVVSDDSVFSADALACHAIASGGDVDVTVACAGNLSVVGALRERPRNVRVLVGPVGMTRADLRELAMSQVSGDIVTLVDESTLAGPRPVAGSGPSR